MPARRAAHSPARRLPAVNAQPAPALAAAAPEVAAQLPPPPPLQRTSSEEALYQAREDDYLCPICLDVLTYPVSLVCGHNVCRTCLIAHLEVTNGNTACPSGCPAVPIRIPNVNLSLQVAVKGSLTPSTHVPFTAAILSPWRAPSPPCPLLFHAFAHP